MKVVRLSVRTDRLYPPSKICLVLISVRGWADLLRAIVRPEGVRGGADKSLARPGRKQATATKLGIYSTYSPRSSIHFLAHALTFASHSKNFRRLSVQPGLCIGQKMATFQLFFQSREQVVVQWGQIQRIGWVIKTLEAQAGQSLLGCKCPGSRGIVVQEQFTSFLFSLGRPDGG